MARRRPRPKDPLCEASPSAPLSLSLSCSRSLAISLSLSLSLALPPCLPPSTACPNPLLSFLQNEHPLDFTAEFRSRLFCGLVHLVAIEAKESAHPDVPHDLLGFGFASCTKSGALYASLKRGRFGCQLRPQRRKRPNAQEESLWLWHKTHSYKVGV